MLLCLGEALVPTSKPMAIAGGLHGSSFSAMPSTGGQNHCHELNAAALEDLERILPAGSLAQTFQGCKANLAFSPCKEAHYLPLQVKAATLNIGTLSTYFFNVNHGVNKSMLLLCRPLSHQGGTLVIPEAAIPRAMFAFTFRKHTKYYHFLVHDGQLGGVLKSIYDAVRAGQGEFTLPSGKVIDVSQLKLKGIDVLSMPTSPTDRKARECCLLRQQWLPGLTFTEPSSTYTVVDAVVEGIRIADAVANVNPKGPVYAYQASVKKNIIAPRMVPYQEGDFDALWVFHPDKVHMWLIPAHELVDKGVMATPQQQGKKLLCLYDQSYAKPASSHPKADLWTQEYLLSSQDPDLMAKVLRALGAVKR